jgi:hypothetical protein
MSLESAGHISSPSSGYTLFEAVDSGGWGNSLGYKVVTAGETSSASWSGLASDEFSNAVSVYRGIDAADSTCNSNFMMLGAGC